MRKIFLILPILFLLTLMGCSKEAKPPVEGNPAPDFTLNTLNGEVVKLSDLKGQVVIVNFWATWCPPCREEIPSMMRLNAAMAGKPFRMLCVSIDDGGKVAVEEFFRKTGFSLPALMDTDKRAGKLYGITGVPETFVIDRHGVILKKVVGAMEWDHPEVIAFLNNAIAQAK
ncbi:TlpA family protein disulfide reductase [Geobacter hydrogenophilus]|uniref:Thioredoxin n=1 Tax=Geobacter hydrogenophilus TaxID=40983 RepID=A0A9W6G3F8_9BACT|nr:TlpA disulfide reductase family protein [Geobacter hydrogenophilus]MBT0892405.1 TlpA family protein disulfide reductase [Geobacter hydrogenophilus]GLI39801.1 thioredoxin [Geobacter hydrogenophilus]